MKTERCLKIDFIRMQFQLDGTIEKSLAFFTQYFEKDISAVIVQR